MQVKVPGFKIEVKTIWAIVIVLWTILSNIFTWYMTHREMQEKIEDRIEQTTGQVGGLTSTFQDRIKVTDSRFEKLETGQSELNEKVTTIQGDVKGMSKQVDNLVLLVSALLRDKVAENPAPVAHPAVYEVP